MLLQQFDDSLALPPAPGRDYHPVASTPPKAGAAPHTPMTSARQEAARVMIRRDFLAAVTQACSEKFPKQAAQYQKAFDQWRSTRKDRLSQGEMLLVPRTSREDAAETSALTEVDQKTIKAWQVGKLGIPMNRAP